MSSPKKDWDSKGLWAPYVPDDNTPWDLRRVVHLHRRAGFAAIWNELQRDLKDGPAKSIDRLLQARSRKEVPDNFRTFADQLAERAGDAFMSPWVARPRARTVRTYRKFGHPSNV